MNTTEDPKHDDLLHRLADPTPLTDHDHRQLYHYLLHHVDRAHGRIHCVNRATASLHDAIHATQEHTARQDNHLADWLRRLERQIAQIADP